MSRLSDETRLRMLRAAEGAERRNRPRWMPRLGLLAVLIALLYAGLGWFERGRALDQLRAARSSDAGLTLVLEEIERLRETPNQGGPRVYEPLAGPQTSMEAAAVAVGLDAPAPPTLNSAEVTPGIDRKIYFYKDVRHSSAETLFEWLVEVERTIEGMRVHELDLKTVGETGWLMDVRFSRLETSS